MQYIIYPWSLPQSLRSRENQSFFKKNNMVNKNILEIRKKKGKLFTTNAQHFTLHCLLHKSEQCRI